MRLFTKIFLCGVLVCGLAFSIPGYFLLHYSMENSMVREAEFALQQYQYDKFTVQSAFLDYADFTVTMVADDYGQEGDDVVLWKVIPKEQYGFGTEKGMGRQKQEDSGFLERNGVLAEPAEEIFSFLAEEIDVPVAFYAQDKTLLYSEIEGMEPSFLNTLSESAHVYQFWTGPNGSCVLVGSVLDCGGQSIYFVSEWNIDMTVSQQEMLQQYFLQCYLAAMAVGMILLGILSVFLTGPLKRMSRAAYRIAEGDYGERLVLAGKDEIGELALSFNRMADAVEEKMEELSEAAREKEDFVANFAHEIKTPLTSIIGYADMIYQRELPRQDVRDASFYIWNEGMRLEALSLKLMDLTVLGRQEFPLQEMAADELLQDVADGLRLFLTENQITLRLEAEAAYIRVDYDLLKTLLINLMDNSRKAGCSRIELTGRIGEEGYRICVEDDGCGMEEEELSRITEAFYMVDKARSRRQHGAGLGLALADRIARLHGCELVFESRKGEGTKVSFTLKYERGEMEDGDEEKE